MLNIIMVSIGLICIVFSVVYINKVSKKEKNIYDELILIQSNIKDYHITIENTINSFEELIDNSLDKLTNYEKEFLDHNLKQKKLYKETNKEINKNSMIIMDNNTTTKKLDGNLHENIEFMRSKGYPPEVIAKKLNIGVREVEIIMKLTNNC